MRASKHDASKLIGKKVSEQARGKQRISCVVVFVSANIDAMSGEEERTASVLKRDKGIWDRILCVSHLAQDLLSFEKRQHLDPCNQTRQIDPDPVHPRHGQIIADGVVSREQTSKQASKQGCFLSFLGSRQQHTLTIWQPHLPRRAMSHGAIDDVFYQNMNLLQDILEKQGRIVRLEQQVYSQLEAELRVATEAADDAASDKANLLDVDLDAASELDPEEDNISATIWTRRDASPGPATAQKRRRSPRRERAPSESKLTVLEKEQKPWPSPTDEDSSSSYTSSWAKDLSPMSPPSYSPSSASAKNKQKVR